MLRWGLVPSWAGDPRIGNRLINARAETVSERPAYRQAFRFRRCLMPADGFFEWRSVGRSRLPFYARLRDDRPFAFAGLWEARKGEDGGTRETCALITTEANALLHRVHDRMPVLLGAEEQDLWLDPQATAASLEKILRPYPAGEMLLYQVSRWVNDPRHDDARCVEPIQSNEN